MPVGTRIPMVAHPALKGGAIGFRPLRGTGVLVAQRPVPAVPRKSSERPCRPYGARMQIVAYPALRFAACWAMMFRAYGAGFCRF